MTGLNNFQRITALEQVIKEEQQHDAEENAVAEEKGIKQFIAKQFNAKFYETKTLKFWFPTKDQNGNKIDNSNHVADISAFISIMAGGCMEYEVLGVWVNPKNNYLVEEKAVVIEVKIFENEFINIIDSLAVLFHNFGKETNQQELIFEYDSVIYRITDFNKNTIE